MEKPLFNSIKICGINFLIFVPSKVVEISIETGIKSISCVIKDKQKEIIKVLVKSVFIS